MEVKQLSEEIEEVSKLIFSLLQDSEKIDHPAEAVQALELTKYQIQRKTAIDDIVDGKHLSKEE